MITGQDESSAGAGRRVGPYRLLERLAAGGMGEVWRAWDERLRRPVAIKHILAEILDHPGARERFRREAEAGARLSHPAIVQIHDLVESAEGDWIVMELVEGESLRQILAAGPLPVSRAVQLGAEIAEGLAAAHAQGIVHRDLKAGNVMVTREGHAKLLDFGIARRVPPEGQEATLSQSGLLLGTVYAMSPEQALGLPLDRRSDLFSLGSLLYEMVTGEAPFRAGTAAATLARICSYSPVPARQVRPEVPPDLSELIGRLLAKEPSARPQDAGGVAALLRGIAAALQPAPPPSAAGAAKQGTDLEEPTLRGITRLPAAGDASSTYPRLGRPFAPLALLCAGALLLALGLAWQGGHLTPPGRAAGTYQLYERGLTALHRYDKRGNLDAAIADFREILAREPDHAPAHAALARACLLKFRGESKDPMWRDQALPLAQRAVALDGYLASARVSLGMVYISLGRLGEATGELERARRLDPLNADAQIGLGQVYEAETRLAEAESAYRQAIALRPDLYSYNALGSLYVRTGRLDEAISAFQKSIELAPDSYLGYRNLGTAWYAKGELAKASAQLQKALEIEPRPSLYANLGTIQFTQGLYAQAAETFERALKLAGGANDYLLWGNLGDAQRWTPGGARSAREAYTRAIQLVRAKLLAAPQDATLHSRLLLYLAKRGDCAQALAAGEALRKLRGRDAASHLRQVVAHEVCGRRGPALAALEAALRAGAPLAEVQRDPELLALRSDVRYHRLLVRQAEAAARR